MKRFSRTKLVFKTITLLQLFVIFLWHGTSMSQSGFSGQRHERATVFDTPVNFSGWQGYLLDVDRLNEIRIGLFAPNSPEHPVGNHMRNAAELAIEEANLAGGFHGVPFSLFHRGSDEPWGAASKEMIRLVYKDSVWAVIGSLNGETTHIAEQISTKAWIPLLSPVSADPTLTYIRIPWIFRLPPDDKKQAQIIVEKGIQAMSLKKIGLITSTDHDSRIFAMAMRQSLQSEQVSPLFHLQVSSSNCDFQGIVENAGSFHPDGIIIRLPIIAIHRLLEHFQADEMSVPLFVPWIPGVTETMLTTLYQKEILYVQPFSEEGNPAYDVFVRDYRRRYNTMPTPSAAYTYDAVNLIIQSLMYCGLNRARLRNAIFASRNFYGVTGKISWDNGGGNQIQPVLRRQINAIK